MWRVWREPLSARPSPERFPFPLYRPATGRAGHLLPAQEVRTEPGSSRLELRRGRRDRLILSGRRRGSRQRCCSLPAWWWNRCRPSWWWPIPNPKGVRRNTRRPGPQRFPRRCFRERRCTGRTARPATAHRTGVQPRFRRCSDCRSGRGRWRCLTALILQGLLSPVRRNRRPGASGQPKRRSPVLPPQDLGPGCWLRSVLRDFQRELQKRVPRRRPQWAMPRS